MNMNGEEGDFYEYHVGGSEFVSLLTISIMYTLCSNILAKKVMNDKCIMYWWFFHFNSIQLHYITSRFRSITLYVYVSI